jgi:hypothetical protein
LITVVNALNPFRTARLEREKDREMILEVAREIGDALRKQSEVSLESLRVMGKFLHSFETTSEPESRTVRNEDEVNEAMSRYHITSEQIEENDFNPFTPTF